MKTKILSLMTLSILASIILMSFASAVSLSEITTYTIPSDVQQESGTFNIVFDLTNTGVEGTLNFSESTITSGASIAFDDEFIADDFTETITATITFPTTMTGSISGTIDVIGEQAQTHRTLDFSVSIIETPTTSDIPEEVTTCESTGNPGNDLRIKNIDFTNNGMKTGNSPVEFGDDNEWFPLDDIEVEIEIENNGDDDFDNIEIEWGLWDTQEDEWVIELDDEKDFNLKDGKDEILTIKFNLENSLDIDFDELTDGDHYRFYVIANAVNDETDEAVCANDYEDIEIIIEENFVVLTDFQFPESVACGDEFQVLAEIWNIGDEDQDDVYVRVFNTELGINEIIEIGDIDAYDNDDFKVTIEIPEDADEKIHSIRFNVYDEDDDIYENDFDDDLAEFHVLLTVDKCQVQTNALVSASLESGGVAGEALVVKATIVNTGKDLATYNLNVAGYSQWASLGSIEPNTFVISEGESRDVLITFNLADDASGEQTFDIEIVSGGELVLTQPVSVSIESKSGFSFTGGVIGSSNAYLWGIGLLNIILVIIIIIVAIRVARK